MVVLVCATDHSETSAFSVDCKAGMSEFVSQIDITRSLLYMWKGHRSRFLETRISLFGLIAYGKTTVSPEEFIYILCDEEFNNIWFINLREADICDHPPPPTPF